MEDVLEVYTRPYDPLRPQVCLDETSRQLLGEVTPSLPPAPGRPAREDYEYVRQGVCNVFWSASRWLAGATSPVATGAPGSTGRTASRSLSMSTTRLPSGSSWSKTTSTPTPRLF